MSAPTAEALKLQRPLPDDQLMIVARGEREDPPPNKAPELPFAAGFKAP